jgi:hypothetical protein
MQGYFETYPDYMPRYETLEALQGNLKDIYRELRSRNIPYVLTVADLEAA